MNRRTLTALSALFFAGFAGCSLFNGAGQNPSVALSQAILTADCGSRTASAAQIWMACTVLSQTTFVCKNVSSGAPADEQIVQLITAFAPDPVLSGIAGMTVSAANATLATWCSQEGYSAAAAAAANSDVG
jgi:hypothetical protein